MVNGIENQDMVQGAGQKLLDSDLESEDEKMEADDEESDSGMEVEKSTGSEKKQEKFLNPLALMNKVVAQKKKTPVGLENVSEGEWSDDD